MIATVQDGVITITAFIIEFMVQHFRCNPVDFIGFITAVDSTNHFTGAQVTPQLFFKHMRIVLNQLIGCLENAAGRSIVLFELDDFQVSEIVFKPDQIFWAGAAPGID